MPWLLIAQLALIASLPLIAARFTVRQPKDRWQPWCPNCRHPVDVSRPLGRCPACPADLGRIGVVTPFVWEARSSGPEPTEPCCPNCRYPADTSQPLGHCPECSADLYRIGAASAFIRVLTKTSTEALVTNIAANVSGGWFLIMAVRSWLLKAGLLPRDTLLVFAVIAALVWLAVVVVGVVLVRRVQQRRLRELAGLTRPSGEPPTTDTGADPPSRPGVIGPAGRRGRARLRSSPARPPASWPQALAMLALTAGSFALAWTLAVLGR